MLRYATFLTRSSTVARDRWRDKQEKRGEDRSGALGGEEGGDRPANGHGQQQTQTLQPEKTVVVYRIAVRLMPVVV